MDRVDSTATSLVPIGSAWRDFLLPMLPAMLLEMEEEDNL
jgi:hypothetical protein